MGFMREFPWEFTFGTHTTGKMAEALANNSLVSDEQPGEESPAKGDACPEQQPAEDGDTGSSTESDYSDFEGMQDVYLFGGC